MEDVWIMSVDVFTKCYGAPVNSSVRASQKNVALSVPKPLYRLWEQMTSLGENWLGTHPASCLSWGQS